MKDRLDELIERINPDLERREHHIARLNQTLRLYGEEIAHDIKDSQWQSVYQSGLHAGYLHCLLGNTQQGLEMLQKVLLYMIQKQIIIEITFLQNH